MNSQNMMNGETNLLT